MAAKKIPGLLLFLDFENAFDTLKWLFIQKHIISCGFGPSIVQWLKTFITTLVLQGPRSKFLRGAGAKLDEIFFGGGGGCFYNKKVSIFSHVFSDVAIGSQIYHH